VDPQVHSQTSFNGFPFCPSPPIMTRLVSLIAWARMCQRLVQGGSFFLYQLFPVSILVQTCLELSLGAKEFSDPPNTISRVPSATISRPLRLENCCAELVCRTNSIAVMEMEAAHTSLYARLEDQDGAPPAKMMCVDVLATANSTRRAAFKVLS